MKHALEVFLGEKLIFFSDGKWLHPLFELEKFIAANQYPPENFLVKDKIVGKAAALILVYLGVRNIHAKTMSKPARDFLSSQPIKFEFVRLIERVACRTEDLLFDQSDPETGYLIVKDLRQRALSGTKK